MLLEPTDSVADPFPFSTSGLQIGLRISDDGSLKIAAVYADSPAERAGLIAGDRILSVNSRPVIDLGIEAIRDLLKQAPGTRVRLEVRQGDSSRDVELELDTIL